MTTPAGKAPLPGTTTYNETRLLKRMRFRIKVHGKSYITCLHPIIDVYP
jgi:hypothetical protein